MTSLKDINSYVDLAAPSCSPDSFPITPHATNALPRIVRAIRAKGAGDVVAVTAAGEERTIAFEAGETRYVICTHVRDTSTATGLEGMP